MGTISGYLVDQTGERWDISQAVSIGYDPRKFEFGIGRHAFRSLDENDWASEAGSSGDIAAFRKAGVTEAHAAEITVIIAQKTLSNYFNHINDTDLDLPAAPEV